VVFFSDGRFISKDTWQGDYYRPLSLNGWIYVVANPVRYSDPFGRCIDFDLDGVCDPKDPNLYQLFEQSFGVTFDKHGAGFNWEDYPAETQAAIRAISKVADRLAPYAGLSPEYTFQRVFGGIDFFLADLRGYFGWTSGPHKIKIQPGVVVHDPCNNRLIDFQLDPLARLFVHEMGHAFSGRLDEQYRKTVGGLYYNNPEHLLQHEGIYDPDGNFVTGYDRSLGRYSRNAGIDPNVDPDKYPYLGGTYYEYRWVNGVMVKIYTGYQWHSERMDSAGNTAGEDWADIFMNWVYGSSFNINSLNAWSIFFWAEERMQEWVDVAIGKPVR